MLMGVSNKEFSVKWTGFKASCCVMINSRDSPSDGNTSMRRRKELRDFRTVRFDSNVRVVAFRRWGSLQRQLISYNGWLGHAKTSWWISLYLRKIARETWSEPSCDKACLVRWMCRFRFMLFRMLRSDSTWCPGSTKVFSKATTSVLCQTLPSSHTDPSVFLTLFTKN